MTVSTPKRASATTKTAKGRKPAAKTTAPKTGTKPLPKTVVKATPKVTAPSPNPKVVSTLKPVVSEPDMRKKELIDLAVARSGVKKKDAKPTVEAVLAILGEAIADGRELNLQPFGKLRINRSEMKPNGKVIVCKLRQSNAAKEKLLKVPVAKPAE